MIRLRVKSQHKVREAHSVRLDNDDEGRVESTENVTRLKLTL